MKQLSLRVISFVFVCIFLLKMEGFAQFSDVEKKVHIFPYSYKNYKKFLSRIPKDVHVNSGVLTPSTPLFAIAVPADLFVQRLGFVCRQEYKLQKVTSIPFRFRLGSLAYTDYMEQKPNALKPN